MSEHWTDADIDYRHDDEPTVTFPEPADQTRADVVLSEGEEDRLRDAVFAEGYEPAWKPVRAEVERILADRLAAERAEHAAEVEQAREDGFWQGHADGRDEAETRDLNYDAMTDRAVAAEATVARVRALHPMGDWHEEWTGNGRNVNGYDHHGCTTCQTDGPCDTRAALDGERP